MTDLRTHAGTRPRRTRRFGLGSFTRDAVLAVAALAFALPVIWLFLAPTRTEQQLKYGLPFGVGNPANILAAWRDLYAVTGGVIVRWVENSLVYSSSTVALNLILCVTAGYGLAKFTFLGRKTLLITTLIGMIVPAAALILPLYTEFAAVNLVGTAWSVILPMAFYPWGTYLAYTFFVGGLPDQLLEAARVDGASELRIFFGIALPLAKPLVALIAFFGFVNAWTNFMLPFLMLNDSSSYPLPVGLGTLNLSDVVTGKPDFSASILLTLPDVALAGVITVLPILLMFLFAQRFLVSARLAGAEKG